MPEPICEQFDDHMPVAPEIKLVEIVELPEWRHTFDIGEVGGM